MTFDEMLLRRLLTEASVEQVAAELIELAKNDPQAGMALIDFIFEPDDDASTNDTTLN